MQVQEARSVNVGQRVSEHLPADEHSDIVRDVSLSKILYVREIKVERTHPSLYS